MKKLKFVISVFVLFTALFTHSDEPNSASLKLRSKTGREQLGGGNPMILKKDHKVDTCLAAPSEDHNKCAHLLLGDKHEHAAKKNRWNCDDPPSNIKVDKDKLRPIPRLPNIDWNEFAKKYGSELRHNSEIVFSDKHFSLMSMVDNSSDKKSTSEWLEWYNWYMANCHDNLGNGAAHMIDMMNFQIKQDISQAESCEHIVARAISPILVYMPNSSSVMFVSLATLLYRVNKDDLKKLHSMWIDYKQRTGGAVTLFGSRPEANSITKVAKAQIVLKISKIMRPGNTSFSLRELEAILNASELESFTKAGPFNINHPFFVDMNRHPAISSMPADVKTRATAYFEKVSKELVDELKPIGNIEAKLATMTRKATGPLDIRVVKLSDATKGLSPAGKALFGTAIPLIGSVSLASAYSSYVLSNLVGYGTNIDGEKIFFSEPKTICEEYKKGRMPGLEKKIPLLLQIRQAIDLSEDVAAPSAATRDGAR